jgi:serine/threonine protein kinase
VRLCVGLAAPVDEDGNISVGGGRGTKGFRAPELLKENKPKNYYGLAADTYSLAMTMRKLAKRYSGSFSAQFKQLVKRMSTKDALARPLPRDLLNDPIFRSL